MATRISKAERAAQAAAPHPVQPANPDAEATVTVSVTLPRRFTVDLLKVSGATVTRDLSDWAAVPAAVEHVVRYGLSRFNRDGASPDERVACEATEPEAKAVAGSDPVTYDRPATQAERAAQAVKLSDAKWSKLLAGTLKARVGGTSDPLVGVARTLLVKALVKRNVARKAIPKLPDLATMEQVATAHGIAWEKVKTLAQGIVATMAGGDDL